MAAERGEGRAGATADGWPEEPAAGAVGVLSGPACAEPTFLPALAEVPWVLDLRPARWTEPIGLAGIAALAHAAALTGARASFRGPLEGELGTYLARMRLGEVLADLGVPHDLPWVEPRDRSADLLELTAFRDEREVEALAGLVHDQVAPRHPTAARALHQAIVEVGGNVPEHARTPLGFLAAQTRPSTGRMLFAVADAGVGLRTTLAGRGATSDADAVRMALTGVSERADPGAGRGLVSVLAHTSALGGHLYLASGQAAARAYGAERALGAHRPGFPGTLLQGRITVSREPRARAGAPEPTHGHQSAG